MTLIALRCPNCSGDIALDDSREFGFCLYCGTKIMVQKDVKAESSVSAQLSNLKPIVEKSFQDGKLEKSLEYSDRLISENAADADVWYMRGICLALRDGFRIDGDRDSKESYSLKPTKEAMSCFYNYAALSGKEVDFPKESLPLYEAMARRGNWMAMRWTTFCYGLGIGMDIDYDKAVYFYLSLTTHRTGGSGQQNGRRGLDLRPCVGPYRRRLHTHTVQAVGAVGIRFLQMQRQVQS